MRTIYHKNRLIDKFLRLFYTICIWGMNLPDNITKFLRYSKMRFGEGVLDLFHVMLFFGAYIMARALDFRHWLHNSAKNVVL